MTIGENTWLRSPPLLADSANVQRGVSLAIALLVHTSLLANPASAELSQKQIHQEMLGNARANVDFSQGLHESARVLWMELATMGNAHAMYSLGVMYRDGLGVVKNPKQAFEWFEKAAQQGEPRSLLELSECWRQGYGTRASVERADDLIMRAAFAGVPEAQLQYGRLLLAQGAIEQAGYWLTQAERGNITEAQAELTSARAQGYTPEQLPTEIQRRIDRFLEEMDSALNSRDPDIYQILIQDDALIAVRLPGDATANTLSTDQYVRLWTQTFAETDRFRAHRGDIKAALEGDVLLVTSQIHEYAVSGDSAQQLDLRETLRLIETPYGLRVIAIHLLARVPSTPLLAP